MTSCMGLTIPPMDFDAHEELLKRLRAADAPKAAIADAAWAYLTQLLDAEHLHLAALHASQYAAYLDSGRKLEALGRMTGHGMDAYITQLCCSWGLVQECQDSDPQLYRELFPKLPPRTDRRSPP